MTLTLHGLLEASAGRCGSHLAVEDPARGTSIGYRELDAWSAGMAAALASRGRVLPGDRVGLCCSKSIGAVAAIFGTLKSGAAYVPVDVTAPLTRALGIFEDCGVRAIVLDAGLVDAFTAVLERPLGRQPVTLPQGDDGSPALVIVDGPQPGPPAKEPVSYILYTSGSTGQPKGVVHTHASALSFVNWCSSVLAPRQGDRFSSHAPFHFDLSILDLYVSVKHGATLVLIGEELGKAPAQLGRVIAERRISVWYSTPSVLRNLVAFGNLDRYDWSALRIVLFAGEVFPLKDFRLLKRAWPVPRYFNLYGPTETNVCTYYEVPAEIPADREAPFPIGRACENARDRVVDDEGLELSASDPGELTVSGGSVMLGYWNPGPTDQAFLTDATGVRWYRTGDFVRRDRSGNYLFLGRRDRMVKKRGYRVELGEIEAALSQHPAVVEAGVVAVPAADGSLLVRAFVSCSLGEATPTLIGLKNWCAQRLPLYMVPDRITTLVALPRTSTDKLDYQAMARLD